MRRCDSEPPRWIVTAGAHFQRCAICSVLDTLASARPAGNYGWAMYITHAQRQIQYCFYWAVCAALWSGEALSSLTTCDVTLAVFYCETQQYASVLEYSPDRRKNNFRQCQSFLAPTYTWSKERKTSCYISIQEKFDHGVFFSLYYYCPFDGLLNLSCLPCAYYSCIRS
jgi:hypothetical protein